MQYLYICVHIIVLPALMNPSSKQDYSMMPQIVGFFSFFINESVVGDGAV